MAPWLIYMLGMLTPFAVALLALAGYLLVAGLRPRRWIWTCLTCGKHIRCGNALMRYLKAFLHMLFHHPRWLWVEHRYPARHRYTAVVDGETVTGQMWLYRNHDGYGIQPDGTMYSDNYVDLFDKEGRRLPGVGRITRIKEGKR